jgi:hypothetical protein
MAVADQASGELAANIAKADKSDLHNRAPNIIIAAKLFGGQAVPIKKMNFALVSGGLD